jgi:nitrous oxide reductase
VTKGDALSPFHLEFVSGYGVWKVQIHQKRLKSNGTRELLVSSNDVNLLGKNIDNIKENTEASLMFSKEVGLEVNAEKTEYMFMSRDKNARHHTVKTGNKPSEGASKVQTILNGTNE